ncbi:hypothetical protein ASF10_14690 [Flavobacterium sp. Leaf82]|uniref:hypothetical protein n=1 Tax=Flavobacterium sp. Leaf82 TaxID=1736238 RepID=UPI0006F30A45|nr:hypothetical protein [Flavobacterium sp. Leaf82]KQO20833.1 hypothetical protein ASF10_14690 [Flavobacterium sp. Leaf82]
MTINKTLITVLGWEERYFSSNVTILENYNIDKIILICFQDYFSMKDMQVNYDKTISLATDRDIELKSIDLQYGDSINNWTILETFFIPTDENYLLNITTIPRDTIWTLFFFLKRTSSYISYAYFKPLKYSDTWLTRNHKNPRLLFKHSGLIDLHKDLALFIISGFDLSRLDQIIAFYEPHKVLIFAQMGAQFENLQRNNNFNDYIQNHGGDIEILSIDSYNVESSSELLTFKYNELKDKYNVVIDSQGPKISSLSVYNAYMSSDGAIALAYVPVKDFHSEYSSGIDNDLIAGDFYIK